MALIPQTSYGRYFASAFAGQLAENGPHQIRESQNGNGSAVAAGVAVVEGDNANTFEYPDAATDKMVGVVLNTFARNPGDQATSLSGTDAIMNGDQANLLESGAVWMVCEEAMLVGSDVYIRHTANGAGKLQLGAIRTGSDTNTARRSKGLRVLEPSSGAGVCKVWVDVATDRADV